ncbi:MAG: AP2 domain-containing protein [Pseudomonadota bacterium]
MSRLTIPKLGMITKLEKSDKYHGVYYDSELPEHKRWVARSNMTCGRFVSIGNFATELEAAKAYNDYVEKYSNRNVYPFFKAELNDLGDKIQQKGSK